MAELKTADLSDAYSDILQYVYPGFRDYGMKKTFGGKISTVKCHEDNVLVKQALSEPGNGKVKLVKTIKVYLIFNIYTYMRRQR